MIEVERIKILNIQPEQSGKYVLYWMQAAQREQYNQALEYSIMQANRLGLPLVVYFGLTDDYPGANLRHYQFMLEGLIETARFIEERGATFVLRRISPEVGVVELAKDAALVVVDRGYTRFQRNWRRHAADHLPCKFVQIETESIVPIEAVSDKEEYAAATFRPKLHRQLERFLVPIRRTQLNHRANKIKIRSESLSDLPSLLAKLDVDHSVQPVANFRGGATEALRRLQTFIKHKLDRYDHDRNDPTLDGQSNLSPYLHFGQISALQIALNVRSSSSASAVAYLDELITWRELAMNFVIYNDTYDQYAGLPAWARGTLQKHKNDTREYLYDRAAFEHAATHDPYWNAAQTEMTAHGKMHGYMRMYWAKKILEWSATPEDAFETALYLNDKYELDGRDPNGYAGVAWAFGKHDRPWAERPIFGMIRYMNAAGLRRKFDADGYVRKIIGHSQKQLDLI